MSPTQVPSRECQSSVIESRNSLVVQAFAAVLFAAALPILAQAPGGGSSASPAAIAPTDPVPVPCPSGIAPAPKGWRLIKASLQAAFLRATQSQQTYQSEILSLRE